MKGLAARTKVVGAPEACWLRPGSLLSLAQMAWGEIGGHCCRRLAVSSFVERFARRVERSQLARLAAGEGMGSTRNATGCFPSSRRRRC